MVQKKVSTKSGRIGLKEVAKEAGVSIASVSYVMNGRDIVTDATKQRVLSAIEKLNYRPNKHAQTMRTGKTDAVGLILPDLSNPFFPPFAKAIQRSASDEGKNVFLIDCNNDPIIELEGVQSLYQQFPLRQ